MAKERRNEQDPDLLVGRTAPGEQPGTVRSMRLEVARLVDGFLVRTPKPLLHTHLMIVDGIYDILPF